MHTHSGDPRTASGVDNQGSHVTMASTTGLGWRRWGGRRAHGQRRPFPSYRVRDQHQAPWGPPGKGDLGAWKTCCWRDWKGGRIHGVLEHPWNRLPRLWCGNGSWRCWCIPGTGSNTWFGGVGGSMGCSSTPGTGSFGYVAGVGGSWRCWGTTGTGSNTWCGGEGAAIPTTVHDSDRARRRCDRVDAPLHGGLAGISLRRPSGTHLDSPG